MSKDANTKIVVPNGALTALAAQYKCCTRTIYRALNGTGARAAEIRRAAIAQYGGAELMSAPRAEVCYKSDGTMYQHFGGGVMLTASREDGTITLYDKGVVVDRVENATIEQLMRMQGRAQQLADRGE